MNWLQRYRIRLYLRNSIWVLPAFGIVAALLAVALLVRIDETFGWQLKMNPDTARSIMSTVAGSMFTLVVLVSSTVLVAVQLASAQLTPRIIALIYRNPFRKLALALFIFTFTFSVAVLVRIEDHVPLLTAYLAAYGFLLNLALFLLFIDGVGKTLRPISAFRSVGLAARNIIHTVYPSPLKEGDPAPGEIGMRLNGQPRMVRSLDDGAVLGFHRKGLMTLAVKSNCVIELMPEVGDFIAAGDPLFRIYEGGGDLSDSALQNLVAIGHERTLEQDPLFAFRIIVDIANKALSPAVNDPTTAVLAIDQIHHLLRDIGNRYLAEGYERDAAGKLRLIYRTPNWEDFVRLGTTEIRQYGDESIQVQRRLRAMLENLIETLPARRTPVLQKELALLSLSSKRSFPDLDDQNLAEAADLQGIGGSYDEMPDNHPSLNEAQANRLK
jgi:uncharacterized membrane protein